MTFDIEVAGNQVESRRDLDSEVAVLDSRRSLSEI